MIFIERTITIRKNKATIDEPIQLFIGDGNVELQFTLKDNPFKHRTSLDSTYAKMMINRPGTYPIFSEVAKLKNNKVLFVLTPEMIDEFKEVGVYDFQIALYNNDQTSRASLPSVIGGIVIGIPLCNESFVGYARAGFAKAVNSDEEPEVLEPFDSEGNYNITDWNFGDLITEAKLDKIENAIDHINDSKSEKDHNHDDRYIQEIPSEYITESELATELQELKTEVIDYTDTEIAEAKAYTDSKFNEAKSYTDEEITELKSYTDEEIIKAKNYTDEEVDKAKTYTDSKFNEAKEVAYSLHTEAMNHTNAKFEDAKSYTDTQIAGTQNFIMYKHTEAIKYTDAEITKAKAYTDEEVAELKIYTDNQITEVRTYTDTEITKAKAYTDSEVDELKDHVETNYALKSEIPTKVSELENDVPYITEEDLTVLNEILNAINNGTTPSALTLAYNENSGNLTISGTNIDDTNLEI